jgi:hypothetical protein
MQKLKSFLAILLFLASNSCQTPPNFFACADLGASGHCVEYITKKKFDIDNGKKLYKGKTWDNVRAGGAVIPSDQLAIVKTFFDNFCHENQCPNNIGDWGSFANELSSSVKK